MPVTTILPGMGQAEQTDVIKRRLDAMACGSVTLAANAATTTVNNQAIGKKTKVFLEPTTANAAAERGNGTLYVSAVANGSFTLTHANNAQTDRVFYWFAVATG